MDKIRIVLIAGLILVSMLLVREFVAFKKAEKAVAAEQTMATATPNETYTSDDSGAEIPTISKTSDSTALANTQVSKQLITVETDALVLEIDPKGGDIVSLALKVCLFKKEPFSSKFSRITTLPEICPMSISF